jgi:hypothetical protein
MSDPMSQYQAILAKVKAEKGYKPGMGDEGKKLLDTCRIEASKQHAANVGKAYVPKAKSAAASALAEVTVKRVIPKSEGLEASGFSAYCKAIGTKQECNDVKGPGEKSSACRWVKDRCQRNFGTVATNIHTRYTAAATKINAGARGVIARRRYQEMKQAGSLNEDVADGIINAIWGDDDDEDPEALDGVKQGLVGISLASLMMDFMIDKIMTLQDNCGIINIKTEAQILSGLGEIFQ